jgi:CHAD domain-containing protein
MQDALSGILEQTPVAQPLDPLRQHLQQKGEDARRYGLDRTGVQRIVEALEGASARIEAWEIDPSTGSEPLHAAIERLYRKGRKALARARKAGSPGALHEARKQVKYLELALEPFQNEASKQEDALARIVDRAEAIEQDLGKDHDLAVLRSHVSGLLGGEEANGEPLLAAIEERSERLRAQALKEARKLYKKKPARFLAKIRGERARDDTPRGSPPD